MKKVILALLLLGIMILPVISAFPQGIGASGYTDHRYDSIPTVNYKVIGAFSNEQPLGTCYTFLENGKTFAYCKTIWFNTKVIQKVKI